ncbi:MAG: hypothetical protein COV32_01920 [Candidatus Yonathbacteria bacterium CG10_big_fil_rev_8_21_14_0_10_43_136]|uniref:Uncharacterized protein n=2 Tax=Parcubacteria group TaxID=1794811 RepID=A0A2M7Q513_9BACT|nr:MAG: hypothetical protein AUK15_01995 [Candidatus Nomurabacteria bacterium CG2_30_43_9]PIR40711.1 MAG: hypothetical protein COV32_01920 [Candidatus Yonathbacteria bacterium CG10_big_fil_rev_8_21_14_0_10_43_136]PIX57172.1 MAG: hypothetical protein COZ48_02100 [Candidatus Yonathbacteria bacterium CG_4_10_14_3_um_filter_43_12]PIY58526.1 MAG: hypothetical protein COY98_01605 [Candidatus Yonathbacteria bacterium CG_4_10_14_0_8_um_filter_43_17]PJC21556.1 MAG: hypothetical protein CO060_03470 [Cand
MNEKFKNKIRALREEHFPGRSIRSLDKELEPYFGKHFYAYLSKVEAGALPSLDFIKKIKDSYSLSVNEYEDLVKAYFHQKFEDEIISESQRSGIALMPEPLVFRKVNKKKRL